MDTLQSYDKLPYDRLPFEETEPDFLRALAFLHGFEAADAYTARVLELGCAQGGNLIPMAARYPQGEFVGIDLSLSQVEEGQAFIAKAGLNNIRLLHGDIAELPDDLGTFDFIIAHGVYSWVPDPVRLALLSACRRLLRPDGIAYVSFNVEAGWRRYSQLRALLIQQDRPELLPTQRVEQARGYLHELSYDDKLMQKEVDYLKTASASYLFHEYLTEFNKAHSFGQLIDEVSRHGLRYLGEAGPRRARVELKNEQELSAQERHQRWLEAEARLDEALSMRFRRALLVRDDAPLPHPMATEQLKSLSFSAELMSDEELDFEAFGEQQFIGHGGENFPVQHPLLKTMLVVLSSAFPHVLSHGEAVSHALKLAREYGYRGEADDDFQGALLDLIQLHGIRPHRAIPVTMDANADRPRVSELVRLQATSPGWPVTNSFHRALDVDEWGRKLLAVMDGNRSVEELVTFMRKALAEADIHASQEQVAEHVQNYLDFFGRQGLLG